MIVHCTSSFLKALKELKGKHKKHYGSCALDICDEIKDKSVQELCNDQRPLFSSSTFAVRKIRVANSGGGLRKPGGFRIIVWVSKISDEIGLLYVFPKRGPMGIDNTEPSYNKELFKEFLLERKEKKLVQLDIHNELALK